MKCNADTGRRRTTTTTRQRYSNGTATLSELDAMHPPTTALCRGAPCRSHWWGDLGGFYDRRSWPAGVGQGGELKVRGRGVSPYTRFRPHSHTIALYTSQETDAHSTHNVGIPAAATRAAATRAATRAAARVATRWRYTNHPLTR